MQFRNSSPICEGVFPTRRAKGQVSPGVRPPSPPAKNPRRPPARPLQNSTRHGVFPFSFSLLGILRFCKPRRNFCFHLDAARKMHHSIFVPITHQYMRIIQAITTAGIRAQQSQDTDTAALCSRVLLQWLKIQERSASARLAVTMGRLQA